jgi:sugar phosphate isomerase/epimerase
MIYISSMLYAFLKPMQALQKLYNHGFNNIELSYDNFSYYLKRGAELKELMKEVIENIHSFNLNVDVAHLPYGEEIRLAMDPNKLLNVLRDFEIWFKFYSEIGVNLAAIHIPFNSPLINEDSLEYVTRVRNRAIAFFENISKLADEYGINLAIENKVERGVYGYLPNDLLYLIDVINNKRLGICLDTGHAIVNGFQPSEFYNSLYKHISLIHAHDNDGYRDLHLPPFSTGVIHWNELLNAFKMNKFQGSIVLEVACHREAISDCDNVAKLLSLISKYIEEYIK